MLGQYRLCTDIGDSDAEDCRPNPKLVDENLVAQFRSFVKQRLRRGHDGRAATALASLAVGKRWKGYSFKREDVADNEVREERDPWKGFTLEKEAVADSEAKEERDPWKQEPSDVDDVFQQFEKKVNERDAWKQEPSNIDDAFQEFEKKVNEHWQSGPQKPAQDLYEDGIDMLDENITDQDLNELVRHIPEMPSSPPGRVARRIHVYATHPDARFFAHSLKSIPNAPPITLLFHNKHFQREWLESGANLSVEYPDGTEVTQRGFQAELARSPYRHHGKITTAAEIAARKIKPHWDREHGYREPTDPRGMIPDYLNDELISTLVLCTRSQYVIPSLLAVRHRLTVDSTIFLVTEGMGIVEEIYRRVFPNAQTRPGIVLGLSTHTIHPLPAARDPHFLSHQQAYFRILRWKEAGTLSVCALPRWKNLRDPEAFRISEAGDDSLNATTRYLLRTLRRTPILVPTFMRPVEFHLFNLESLAVQSVLHPVMSLIDGRQSHMLYNFPLTVAARVLAFEICLVIRSLPEIQSYPNLAERFAPARIIRMVTSICFEQKNRIHPAVYEMRRGSRTNGEFLNGYIVKRGEELGMSPIVNYFVWNLVKGKSIMVKHELEEDMDLNAEEFPREVAGARY